MKRFIYLFLGLLYASVCIGAWTGGTDYPSALDVVGTDNFDVAAGEVYQESYHDSLAAAISAIETKLGISDDGVADDEPDAMQVLRGTDNAGQTKWMDVGITDDDIVEIDGSPADGENAVFTANGIKSVISSKCINVENVVAGDDDISMGSLPYAVTITSVWCHYNGTGDTVGLFTLEDGSGNSMTITDTNPVCTAHGTQPTAKTVTASNTLVAYELLRFDTVTAPDPATDDYTICVSYTVD